MNRKQDLFNRIWTIEFIKKSVRLIFQTDAFLLKCIEIYLSLSSEIISQSFS